MTIKVGDMFEHVRTSSWGKQVVHRNTMAVTKLTPKRVYFGHLWFAADDPERVVYPKYLDYRTTASPVRRMGKPLSREPAS